MSHPLFKYGYYNAIAVAVIGFIGITSAQIAHAQINTQFQNSEPYIDTPATDIDPSMLPNPRQDLPLNETELLEAFTDQTHQGSYNFKMRNIETFAFEERTSANGRTRHAHGERVDTGSWRVKANVICFHYENWEGEIDHRACFNIFKRGNCYYHFGLSNYGQYGGVFTARTVLKGDTPDCEPAFV